jgi:hypothetical protein
MKIKKRTGKSGGSSRYFLHIESENIRITLGLNVYGGLVVLEGHVRTPGYKICIQCCCPAEPLQNNLLNILIFIMKIN